MDLAKLRDYMIRLQQAHAGAVQAGDKQKADQFAAIADQAMAHANNAVQGPQGQPGQEGVPGAGAWMGQGQYRAPQGQPPVQGPQAMPPDVAREAKQEAGSSWMDGLFQPHNLPTDKPQVGIKAATAEPASPVGPTAGLPSWLTSPMWGDHNALLTPKEQNSFWGALTDPKWFTPKGERTDPADMKIREAEGLTGWKLNGPMGDAPAPEASGDNYGFENKDAINFDPHAEETIASPQPKKDPYADLGKDPSELGVMDAIGFLLGGNKYIQMKDRQMDSYNNKRFAVGQGITHEENAAKARQEQYAQNDKALAVQMLRHQQEQEQKAQESEYHNARSEMDAYSRSLNPQGLDQIQGFKDAKGKLNRQKQIETKKGN